MKTTRINQSEINSLLETKKYHILLIAEQGFSMLDMYGNKRFEIAQVLLQKFADQVNDRDDTGTLYPKAPISAIPRRFMRNIPPEGVATLLPEFERHVREFFEANRNRIHASRILVDLHVDDHPVPLEYLDIVESVANNYEIEELILAL